LARRRRGKSTDKLFAFNLLQIAHGRCLDRLTGNGGGPSEETAAAPPDRSRDANGSARRDRTPMGRHWFTRRDDEDEPPIA